MADPLVPIKLFDGFQQRHRWLAVPVAVIKKFSDDGASGLAVQVAYYAFFSMFPLLLVAVTVLGFVLHSDPAAQRSIEHSVLRQFPVIGASITVHHLRGHVGALVVGLGTSLLAGLGIVQAANRALDQVWTVPMKHRPNAIVSRLRSIKLLLGLGGLFLITATVSGVISAGLAGPGIGLAGIAAALALNVCLFLVAFRSLGSSGQPVRALLPGALVAGASWEALQLAGGIYINHMTHSTNAYGTFALVIGVLAWLHLGAQLTIYAAEINVVLARGLWPRSLLGEPSAPADTRTLTALALVEERTHSEQIDVSFTSTAAAECSGTDTPGTPMGP